jgi:hypothetical protein
MFEHRANEKTCLRKTALEIFTERKPLRNQNYSGRLHLCGFCCLRETCAQCVFSTRRDGMAPPLALTHNICNFCSSSLLDRLPIRERKGSIHLFPDRIPKIVAVALGCGLALQLGGAIRALDAGRYPHPLRETKFTPPLLHFLQNQRAMVLPKH